MQRPITLAILMALAAVPAVYAQNEDMPWQASITTQLEAFRAGDGAVALSMASAPFREQFSDPDAFMAAIKGLGYDPLVTSRSHAFGKFVQINEQVVMQVVRLVGPDQSLYEATYQVGQESDGEWRAQGVVMAKSPGIGV